MIRLVACGGCGASVSYTGPLDSAPARCFKCPTPKGR